MAKKKKKPTRNRKPGPKVPFDVERQLRKAVNLHQSGRLDKAETIYRKILNRNPDHSTALHFSGLVAHQKGDNAQAAARIRRAIENERGNAMYHNNLGLALEDLGQLEEALSAYHTALSLDDSCYEAHTNIGNILMAQGNVGDATFHHRRALKINPAYTEALLNLVDIAKAGDVNVKELFQLAEELTQTNLPKDDLMRVYFAMGKLGDTMGRFERAFQFFQKANELKRKEAPFDEVLHRELIDRTIDTFTADFVKERRSWGHDSLVPVFVFGMPRSGTTLVEQILASHPAVFGAGELQFFVQAEEKLPAVLEVSQPYPDCMKFLDSEKTEYIAQLYLTQLSALEGVSQHHKRITDKNPFNFLYLGLISLLFPKATLIHCTRHPLDVCLSNYFHLFTQGNHFAYDLEELGSYYLQYDRLMAHWHSILPIDILEVKYEDLVGSQESMTRAVIAHCGLEWDPACLDFYADTRSVFTASNWQVRQPIYKSSLERWRNYDACIGPLKQKLASLVG